MQKTLLLGRTKRSYKQESEKTKKQSNDENKTIIQGRSIVLYSLMQYGTDNGFLCE